VAHSLAQSRIGTAGASGVEYWSGVCPREGSMGMSHRGGNAPSEHVEVCDK
jgi:hypothetical protein